NRSWQTTKRKKLRSMETTGVMSPQRSPNQAEGIPPMFRSARDLNTKKQNVRALASLMNES
ncbi:hypothetical protein HAX54_035665, partial [Datura stramonium]|nr:hypothetical protein [Datura stramonium]